MEQLNTGGRGIKLLSMMGLIFLATIVIRILTETQERSYSNIPTIVWYGEYSASSMEESYPYSTLEEDNLSNTSNTHFQILNSSITAEGHKYLTIEPLNGSCGRLGNFLFRYAAAKGIAQHNNLIMVLPDTDLVKEYRTIFNITAPLASEVPNYNQRWFVDLHEKAWGHFDSNIYTLHPGRDYRLSNVYSQSFKYFQRIANEIRQEFQTLGPHHSSASSLIASLKYGRNETIIISLHVRRGDFLLTNLNKFGYAVAPVGYFMRAIKYFVQKYGLPSLLFLVSSDDRPWCMKNLDFQGAAHYYTEGRTTIDDFMALLLSDHHIVSVGSFSWWLAWLGRGEVIYYRDWPRPGSPHARNCNPEDYYPPHWKPLV